MDRIPNALHFELSIPAGTNEQEFLRLVVQTAIKKYRTLLDRTPSLVTTGNESSALADKHASIGSVGVAED